MNVFSQNDSFSFTPLDKGYKKGYKTGDKTGDKKGDKKGDKRIRWNSCRQSVSKAGINERRVGLHKSPAFFEKSYNQSKKTIEKLFRLFVRES